jgi:hypothetical protein
MERDSFHPMARERWVLDYSESWESVSDLSEASKMQLFHRYLGTAFGAAITTYFALLLGYLYYRLSALRRRYLSGIYISRWEIFMPFYVCLIFGAIGVYEILTHHW